MSELGLGYTSDKTVLFRYCAGACEAALSIDLGQRRLLPPDGLLGRGLFPGRAQLLPHAARAVGAGVRVTLPHVPALGPCPGATPTLARTEFT